MSIRRVDKDHRPPSSRSFDELQDRPIEVSTENDPLIFWTLHKTEPVEVDLTPFRDGESVSPSPTKSWSGAFEGRPNLIAQLAPAIQATLEPLGPNSVVQYLYALRTWWRLFDHIHRESSTAMLSRLDDVGEINELHRQYAYEQKIDRLPFSNFVRLVNITRSGLGLKKLPWLAPERPPPIRHLPPQAQTDEIRFELKHLWFAILRRWETADRLLATQQAENDDEKKLLQNYNRLREVTQETEHARPLGEDLRMGATPAVFSAAGFSVPDMLRGFYPDGKDIRVAFHSCLASTGWNPTTLLAIDVNDDYLTPHPKDPSRYLLRGMKVRGGGESEHQSEGLWKSQSSPGSILLALRQRTEPLRNELRRELADVQDQYELLLKRGGSKKELSALKKRKVSLELGVRSLWIYAAPARGRITWLDKNSFHRGLSRTTNRSFLKELVDDINKKQAPDKQVTVITAGDFRDAFADYAYQVSGGMVLYVKRALNHKRVRSTQDYLDNTRAKAESNRLYKTVSNALWDEVRVHKRVVPSILAARSRYGSVSEDERQRLRDYQAIRRSRIGVGCTDPHHPPKSIAPNFTADGKAMCTVQRCTLCYENAVIFPDSGEGLCKRAVELHLIRNSMPDESWLTSTFPEELANTEHALSLFDQSEVLQWTDLWTRRVTDGEHRVLDLEGIQGRGK